MIFSQEFGGLDQLGAELGEVLATVRAASVVGEVLDWDVVAPPASPTVGDAYLVGANATGAWAGLDGQVVTLIATDTWQAQRMEPGTRLRKTGTSSWKVASAAGWRDSLVLGVSTTGLTASTAQAQGAARLAHGINRVATVAHVGDNVTLPPAREGGSCVVINDGANSMDVFPEADEKIDALAVDAARAVAAGKRAMFFAYEDGSWSSLVG